MVGNKMRILCRLTSSVRFEDDYDDGDDDDYAAVISLQLNHICFDFSVTTQPESGTDDDDDDFTSQSLDRH